ncbi:MAG: autotransporter domain-containing protein [Endomicrobium sp.]|jgi:predicted outer membrane repeat protein|nr:autotransporter domain-containing protein [Endomicrobium sp.]
MYFVRNLFVSFFNVLLILFFFFVFASKIFAVDVNSFNELKDQLQSYSSGETIRVTTPTIEFQQQDSGLPTQCLYTKTIIGASDGGATLDGCGRCVGIYGNGGPHIAIHLSNITFCNFFNTADFDGSKNGSALFFENNSKVYFDGDVSFISNTVTGGGGSFAEYGGDCAGLCLNHATLDASTGITIEFINNLSRNASGAAIYFNGSKLTFNSDTILFQDNKSGDEGGALWAWQDAHIEFRDSRVTFLRNQADFDDEGVYTRVGSHLGIGGAISLKQHSTSISFTNNTEVGFTSNGARNGGAIYGAGTIDFHCMAANFNSNVATSSGGAIFVADGGTLDLDTSKGDIIFENNGAYGGDQAGHDIYFGAGTVNITGTSGRVVITGGIAGTNQGTIRKSGNGLFELGGVNQYFDGLFHQTGGTTRVTGTYFGGTSSITEGGVLNLGEGASFTDATQRIMLYNAEMNINTTEELQFDGQLIGDERARLNKASNSILTLSGDNSGFIGTCHLTDGKIDVTNDSGIARYFGGITSVTAHGMLEIGTNGEFTNGARVGLWENSGRLLITKNEGQVEVNNLFEGNGEIQKIGETLLVVSGNNSAFNGYYIQHKGTTAVSGTFFGGESKISEESYLIFNQGTELVEESIVNIDEKCTLEIKTSTLTINGQLTGYGTIKKEEGNGLLILTGNNSKFAGTFEQSNGTTSVRGGSTGVQYFSGKSIITRSVLEWGNLDFGDGTNITLSKGGELRLENNREVSLSGQVQSEAEGDGIIVIDSTSGVHLLLSGDNSVFSGTFNLFSGAVSARDTNYFTGVTSVTSNGLLIFADKGEVDVLPTTQIQLWNTAGDLDTAGKLEIQGSINFEGSDMLVGNGIIDKTGDGVLVLGYMRSFEGLFLHKNGMTLVNDGGYFGETSVSSITGGKLSFLNWSNRIIPGQLQLWDGGEVSIEIPERNELIIKEGEMIGSVGTSIEKTGAGTVRIEGTSDIFSGLFYGEYIQRSGMTIVSDSDHMFKGTHTIETSTLRVTMNGADNRTIDYKVDLCDEGVLEHISGLDDDLSTTISNIRFTGSNGNAKAKFSGASLGTWYVLTEQLENGEFSEGNEVVFEGCYVDVDSDNYTGATYTFTDSVIDIDFEDSNHIDLSTQPRTRQVTFSNLVTSNTHLNTTIVMQSTEATGSKLISGGSGAETRVKLGILTVGELTGERGHIPTHTVTLLGGNILFEEGSNSAIATLAYEYAITVSTTDAHDVVVEAYKVTDENSLNEMNTKVGDRALKFSFDSTTNTYYIGENLAYMSTGTFYVEGHDDFNGQSYIVAHPYTEKEGVSVFKINDQVDFQLLRVEVRGAQGDKGAALMIETDNAKVRCIGVTFDSNTATQGGGGAIYVSQGARLHLKDTGFIGNIAENDGMSEEEQKQEDTVMNVERGRRHSGECNGGAIHICGATVTLSGTLQVKRNSASGKGGAIYIEDGFLDIIVDTVSTKIFQENTAGGLSNSIWLEGQSVVNFGGDAGQVRILDPINSSGNEGKVNVNGFVDIALETEGRGATVIPNLNVNGNARFNIIGETEVIINSDMRIESSAEFVIDGTAGHGKEVKVGTSFLQEGTLSMNLFGEPTLGRGGIIRMCDTTNVEQYGEQYSTGDSDLINVDGQIELSDSSRLKLATNDAFDDLETFKFRAFKLMKYKKGYTGNFGTVTLVGTLPKSYEMRYDYLGEYIALVAKGYANDDPKFGSLNKLNLCFNQMEVANTLDYYDEAYGNNPSGSGYSGETKILGDKLQDLKNALGDGLEDITSYGVGGEGKNIKGLKEALFDLSGYFISNVIVSRAYDESKRDVYNRIYNYIEYEEPTKGIWAQAKGSAIETDKDVESPQTFKVNNTGVLVGFDMMASSSITAGVYAKQNKSSIRQGDDLHKADINSYGIGVYGGIVEEKYDIKGLLSFGLDNYETTRCLRFENMAKAKGEFGGISAILDVEAGYRIGVASRSVLGRIKLRPYAGVGVGLIHTNGFTEKGANIWNLEVKANNYLRAGLRGGVGFTGEGNKFRWNGSLGLDCILSGRNNEIASRISGGDSLPNGVGNRDFQSRSVTLDVVSAVGDIGFGYYILDGLEAYCSGDIRWSSMVKDISGIIGVRYSFGKWTGKKNIEEAKTDEAKTDEVKTDKVKTDKAKTDEVKTDKVKTEEVKTDKAKTDEAKTDKVKTEEVKTDKAKTDEGKTDNENFKINAVLFEFDKADIKPEAEKEIKALVNRIGKRYKVEKIRIEGHTDALGSDEYNMRLSLARAHAVHEVFAKYGIDTAKMEKIGHGKGRPIDSNETEEGRANNRRVETEIFIDLY